MQVPSDGLDKGRVMVEVEVRTRNLGQLGWASLAGQVILELESAVTVGEHTDLEPQQNLFGDHKVGVGSSAWQT